jgi:hypothetical protein
MDELNKAILDQAKEASLEALTAAEAAEPTAHRLARMCQHMATTYPADVKATGKLSVVVFNLNGNTDSVAAVIVHACVGATPETALELLSRSLHKHIQTQHEARKAAEGKTE